MTSTADRRYLEFEYEDDAAAPTHLWVQGRRFALLQMYDRSVPEEIMTSDGYRDIGLKAEFVFQGLPDPIPTAPTRKRRSALTFGLRRPQ